MISDTIMLLFQVPAAPAAADTLSWTQIGNMSIGTLALLALAWVAKAWRDSTREAAAAAAAAAATAASAAAAAAKESAERAERQNKECAERNERTTQVVDGICERFGETTTVNTKMLTDTVTQLRADGARHQEQFVALAREQREAHERREERLEALVRDLKAG